MSSAVESPVETPVETNVIAIVERLRKLADVCERHEIELSYATVREDKIGIYDADFVRLFKGQELSATRRGRSDFVDVQSELHGITFYSSLWRPLPSLSS